MNDGLEHGHGHSHGHSHGHGDRHGARQPERFDPARAARLEDPARFEYVPLDDVLALLDAPAGARVVDFGAGTGVYALAVAQARPDLRVIALDEQPEMLALLCAKPAFSQLSNVEAAGADALERLRASADRILALNVLHELGDAALADLASLLALGGRALVIDWNAEVERPVGPPRDHVYTPDEARRRLEAAGFKIAGERRFPYHYAFVLTG